VTPSPQSRFPNSQMNMNTPQTPLIDEENPLYCPNFPAAAYMATLRKALQSNASLFQDLSLRSFFWKLGLCFANDNPDHTGDAVVQETLDTSTWSSSLDTKSPVVLARNQVSDDLNDVPVLRRGLAGLAWRISVSCILKRPRDSSGSEDCISLGGSPKRGRSSQSIHTSPVHLSGIEPLSYNLCHLPELSYQEVARTLEGASHTLLGNLFLHLRVHLSLTTKSF